MCVKLLCVLCEIPLSTGCLWLRWAQAVQQSAWGQTVWWRGSRSSSGSDRLPHSTDGNYKIETDKNTPSIISDSYYTEQSKQPFKLMLISMIIFGDALFVGRQHLKKICSSIYCKVDSYPDWIIQMWDFTRLGDLCADGSSKEATAARQKVNMLKTFLFKQADLWLN